MLCEGCAASKVVFGCEGRRETGAGRVRGKGGGFCISARTSCCSVKGLAEAGGKKQGGGGVLGALAAAAATHQILCHDHGAMLDKVLV
jgi:hypothetical protein